ncbi:MULTISPECIES: right-handed parallel beta-helix repeat-containing protein [Spirulina sp. CCY15215]|uniref:right-handed parallel beta-helix repeat-containing protein n=1 Tax=Spirulina sp. CCY15215 TaxID=2767591 RepID=UPI00194EDD59|nr:right-handed parallel beta-helix repeat-containing protein [Spirulina major]
MSLVTSADDRGAGSLREAIANASPGDTITFAANLQGKTITLREELLIPKNLTIDGKDARGIAISGDRQSRVFNLNQQGISATLRNLTITEGKAGGDGLGGGIRMEAKTTLVVENSNLSNNVSTGEGGGGIWTGYQSTTTILNSTFVGNNGTSGRKERGGGAIAGGSEGNLTVKNSTFTNNRGSVGGAINSLLGNLTIENSTFSDNASAGGGGLGGISSGGYGGAIYTDGASATPNASTRGNIIIRNSRIAGSRGAGQGGGLFLYGYRGDKIVVENSTIANNEVIPDRKGESFGGGLRVGGGAELTITNVMFANNRAHVQGGGFWIGDNSSFAIANSSFCNNQAKSEGGGVNLGGGMLIAGVPGRITQTTIANNTAAFQGGGFWGGGANVRVANSILSNNRGINGYNVHHHTGQSFGDAGGNVQSPDPNPKDTKITAGVKLIDPQLSACADNGGAVPTHPRPGNPQVRGGAVSQLLEIENVAIAPSPLVFMGDSLALLGAIGVFCLLKLGQRK